MYIAVYGDFGKKDIRIKLMAGVWLEQFKFQNTLHDAGYDCELFHVNDDELEACVEKEWTF